VCALVMLFYPNVCCELYVCSAPPHKWSGGAPLSRLSGAWLKARRVGVCALL
jgi:hypothetical protein